MRRRRCRSTCSARTASSVEPTSREQPRTIEHAIGLAEQPMQEMVGVAMLTAYVIVTLIAIAANAFMAIGDIMRFKFVLSNAASVGVPESWVTWLGILKAAGAGGLLLGLVGMPLIGSAAAIGLVLFFVGAIVTHLRARNYALGFPSAYLLLAVAALALDLAT
jgi:hypothetical protein